MKESPEALWMSRLFKNVPLAEYHDTLYVTLMLLLRSKHIHSYFQRDLGRQSVIDIFRSVAKIDRNLKDAYKTYSVNDKMIRELDLYLSGKSSQSQSDANN